MDPKDTLAGVPDRLEAHRLIRRRRSDADRRPIFIALTPQGERPYAKVFPARVAHSSCARAMFSVEKHEALSILLRRLRDLSVAAGQAP